MEDIPQSPKIPKIFSDLNFLDLRDEVITGLLNDELNWTFMYQQVCDDCFNELAQVGTVLRVCMDIRCTIFMSPGDKWVECK